MKTGQQSAPVGLQCTPNCDELLLTFWTSLRVKVSHLHFQPPGWYASTFDRFVQPEVMKIDIETCRCSCRQARAKEAWDLNTLVSTEGVLGASRTMRLSLRSEGLY